MFESAVTKAADALRKLRDAHTTLESKTAAAEQELANLRADAGEAELAAILEGVDAGPARARAVELDMQISGLAGARSALRKRIAAAQEALQHARAEEVRAEAAKLKKRLDAHLVESNRLREALEKHEGGCPYVPRVEAEQAIMAANPGIPANHNTVLQWPASMRLKQEVNALMEKAAAIEQARTEDRGQVCGATLDELLAATGENPLCPSAEEIRSTFEEMQQRAIEAWAHHIIRDFSLGTGPAPDERVTSYTLCWVDGRIDRQHSAWQNARRPERWDPSKAKPVSKPAATGDPNEEAAFEEAFKAW